MTYWLYVMSWFKRERPSGLQYRRAKANDYMQLPLLQNTAVKYLFHPLLRHVDRLSPVCTLTGVFYAATYPNQTVCIIHKLFKDVNPVHLHTLTHASMLESCVKTAFSEWRTALTSRKQWVGRATVNGCMSAVGIYSSCLSRDHWVKPP